jgi:branched-chain amino acid transport system ATP-binding protein
MATDALAVENLVAGYGRSEVLHGVSLRVAEHSLCAIVGANGAGKTTLLLAIARILAIRSGTIRLNGADITQLPSHAAVHAGLVLVPEGRRMLSSMSVAENLEVAAEIKGRNGAAPLTSIYDRFPILKERRDVAAGSLSGGEQQMLAMARALVQSPAVLLLDEPSMGLAPKFVDRIFEIIAEERARGTSILLIEQNARKALAIADYAYVLERGTLTLEGTGADLLGRDEVVEAYLGRTRA